MERSEFYDWLVLIINDIAGDPDVRHLSSRKLELINPDIRWEIGPGESTEYYFAFSPNLRAELLGLTNELAADAPKISGWEFLPAKPRKKLKRRRVKLKTAGKLHDVDYEKWEYFLTQFNNGEFFDVNIIPYGHENKDQSDLLYFSSLIVEFELGEELFIQAVDRVNIVLPNELNCETDSIASLNDHILTLWRSIH